MKPIDSLSDDEWMLLVQRAVTMPDAPAHLVQAALEMWRRYGLAPGTQPLGHSPWHSPSMLRRWVAVLSFDSWAGAPVTAGMRALPSEVRHLLFTAEGRDVDLRIAPMADGFALSGQLLGPNGEGRVELAWLAGVGGRADLRSTALDELGEFRLDGLRTGTYLLTLRLAGDEIALPPIEVGPPQGSGGP